MCTRRTQDELRSLPTTPASSSCLHNALASGSASGGCHQGPLGLSPAPRQLGLLRVARRPGQTSLAGARVRPNASVTVTHAASYRPGPCPGSLGTSPLGPTHIPHTHLPPRARRPRARARPDRRERESKGGCRLESAGSAPMKVGSAAAGWEGRKGRRRRRRQAVAHMQWMSGGLALVT